MSAKTTTTTATTNVIPLPVAEKAAPPEHQDVLDSLQLALLSFATKKEVQDIVQKEIINYNQYTKVELIKDETSIKLPEERRHFLFGEIMQSVNMGIPTALIGPAGSGKSTVCFQVAQALNMKFYLQNGVTGTHELTGYMDAHGHYQGTPFRTCFEQGGLMLVDEADSSEAGAFKWINTAIANGYAAFPDAPDPITKHDDFRIVIAANTFGTGADRLYVGSNQLDASTLDRFVFFDFCYDEKMERLLTNRPMWTARVQQLRKAASKERARIVISPRATLNGAKLLGAGWSQDIVEQRTIWKGIDPELKARILKAA